ncbi:hypothetical protein COY05_02285 [Candidatus Peregrinibacteria bacterium CG_4_10_14_0_2_um_filter_38_24]|nr:MAG: hypothetical protein COY05_02285 [Candidatus Peregrinibacteria bacterium CG_4_10_14_0_2_um_filter_38_24]
MDKNKTLEQVEKDLDSLFEKYGIQGKVSVDDIKNWIWNSAGHAMEASNKFQKKCLNLFPLARDIDELNNLMQIFVDAWNYFPHKFLKGRSPAELFHETYGEKLEERSSKSKNKKEMPKVIVGDREMEWEEFQEMISVMEKVQKPFKEWIEQDALPKYQKYLEQIVKIKKICEEHYEVADVFFERALHVGFVDLKSVRPEFIRNEFPRWWSTHIMYSKLKPMGVKKSLDVLFEFIGLVYRK